MSMLVPKSTMFENLKTPFLGRVADCPTYPAAAAGEEDRSFQVRMERGNVVKEGKLPHPNSSMAGIWLHTCISKVK